MLLWMHNRLKSDEEKTHFHPYTALVMVIYGQILCPPPPFWTSSPRQIQPGKLSSSSYGTAAQRNCWAEGWGPLWDTDQSNDIKLNWPYHVKQLCFCSCDDMTRIWCWPVSSYLQGINRVMCKQITSNGICCPVGIAWHGQRSAISISICPPTVSTYRLLSPPRLSHPSHSTVQKIWLSNLERR